MCVMWGGFVFFSFYHHIHFPFSIHVPTCRTFSTQWLSSSFNPLLKLRLCESVALNDDALYWINNYNRIIIMKIGISEERLTAEPTDDGWNKLFPFFLSISYKDMKFKFTSSWEKIEFKSQKFIKKWFLCWTFSFLLYFKKPGSSPDKCFFSYHRGASFALKYLTWTSDLITKFKEIVSRIESFLFLRNLQSIQLWLFWRHEKYFRR